jgi:rhodanese-related sulfurtransferase
MSFQFKKTQPNPYFSDVQDVLPQEVNDNSSQLCLIDVREESEFFGELGHIAGSQLINLSSLPENLHQLPKDKPIVFICRSGGRSAQASSYVQQNGFVKVFNMQGGMLMWNQLMLPTKFE